MTGTHNMIALEFDTQIQLLSRIQFLTRFSSNLVQVTGESGAGKTWLSERYLENWASDSVQSLLICNASQQDAQHRAIILRQIVRDGVFNEQDPMLQSLDYMLEGRSIHALIVIDDAQRVSASIIAELWALVTEAQQRDNWQINVLLFSLRGKLNKWLHKVSYGQGVKPLELEISPLADCEREMFIDVMMVNRQLDAAQRRELKEKAMLLPSLPGALKKLEHQDRSPMEAKKRRSLFPLIILALLLLVIGAGIVWWTLNQPSISESTVITKVSSNGEKKLSDIFLENESEIEQQSGVTANEEARVFSVEVTDDPISLIDIPTVEGMTVGRRDQERRIVVPDSVVEAIIDDQTVGGDGTGSVDASLLLKLTSQSETQRTKEVPNIIIKPDSSSIGASKTDVVVSKADIVAPKENVVLFNQALLAVPDSRYALQLAALKSKSAVQNFLQQYEIQERAQVYETVRNGEAWFMVLIGDYDSVNDARRAELQLSENVQRLTPWVKSFAQIHREIARVN